MDGICSGPSMLLDYFLQPLVTNLSVYIKDSGHLLELHHNYKWEDYVWVSVDVASLYTSIPHEAGLRALEHFLSTFEFDPSKPHCY